LRGKQTCRSLKVIFDALLVISTQWWWGMAGNSHRANCANAQQPGCVCSGCGGSLHGQQGWRTVATEPPQARAQLRRDLLGSLETDPRSRNLRTNSDNRLACLNLARLDIADYLWHDAGGHPEMPTAVKVVSGGSTEFSYVTVLAETLMEQTWPEISKAIDEVVPDKPTAMAVKKRIAYHVWCSLLVALIRVIENIDDTLKLLSDKTKELLRNAVKKCFDLGFAKVVADAVVNVVVDKVWSVLIQLVGAHFPIIGTKSLRGLRILAVFACPSVEQHPELYKHAMQPLMDESHVLITEKVKTWVTALFTAWWRRRGLALAA
jgi:hypothetical protein